jgi:uncharacterized protein YndB with AHSA1/START domain
VTTAPTATSPGVIVVERQLSHSPENIWRALTQSALLKQWFMDNDFQPIVGHRSTFNTDPAPHWNGVTQCEVLEVTPYQRLVYRCHAGTDGGMNTLVTWTLTPTPDGVLLRMEQSGFRRQDEHNFHGAAQGWQRFMVTLGRVLERLDT